MNEQQIIEDIQAILDKANDLKLNRRWAEAELWLRAALRQTNIHLGFDHPIKGTINDSLRRLFEAEMDYYAIKYP